MSDTLISLSSNLPVEREGFECSLVLTFNRPRDPAVRVTRMSSTRKVGHFVLEYFGWELRF